VISSKVSGTVSEPLGLQAAPTSDISLTTQLTVRTPVVAGRNIRVEHAAASATPIVLVCFDQGAAGGTKSDDGALGPVHGGNCNLG
jgi:hypothetical protein